MNTTMNNRINETVELVNQSKTELDNLMDNFEVQTGNLIDDISSNTSDSISSSIASGSL